MTVPDVLHLDGLCMSLTLGFSTFLDLSETYPRSLSSARKTKLKLKESREALKSYLRAGDKESLLLQQDQGLVGSKAVAELII